MSKVLTIEERWALEPATEFRKQAIEATQERLAEFKSRKEYMDKKKEAYPQYLTPRIAQLEEMLSILKGLTP